MSEKTLAEAIAWCDEATAMRLIREQLAAGVPAQEILAQCNEGMLELGNRFAREECFLPDLMFGGLIMKNIMAELGPHLTRDVGSGTAGPRAKAVMGTVQHDVHDIGKDIVVMMLRGAGFEVIDLGVDVPPERFVQAIREHQPAVVGMSLLLTTCYPSVTATVNAIRDAGLRDQVAIMVGGAAASELLAKNAGCDFYGKTAVDGLKFACQVAGLK
ncbi:cobalamin B12-binding domain-containing protein [Thermogutta sp.]|jgi:5-methyltetrahydrofolate--homocysteine methyltransferase|uniref:cobalamin B12-binding domain-containing protein n=1 Tax=Thermogutta sp. TaxID=1962930 RepID=UPI00321FD664